MPEKLKIIAQSAEDLFYQNYKAETDFFNLDDFIFHVGQAISSIYFQLYQLKYKEIREDKKDEVVTFDDSLLNEEILDVQKSSDGYFVKLSAPYMAFPFDNQSVGIQSVFPVDPNGEELERTNISMLWRLKYRPATSRIFFYGDNGKISFANRGFCNIKKVRVLFVPGVNDDMTVPDGIVDLAVTQTIKAMQAIQTGVVVDKTLDQNTNKTIQTEIAPIGK